MIQKHEYKLFIEDYEDKENVMIMDMITKEEVTSHIFKHKDYDKRQQWIKEQFEELEKEDEDNKIIKSYDI